MNGLLTGGVAWVLLATAVPPAPAPLDRVPLRYVPPTLLVEARVNGSAPLPFAFDTGTTTLMLDPRVAAQLGLRTERDRARARAVAVGKAEAYDLEVVVHDLSPIAQRLGVELAGILGYTWMEQFVLEIDYAAGELRVWHRQTELAPSAGTLVVPLEVRTGPGFTGAGIFVLGRLDQRLGCWFEIDTGTDVGVLGVAMARQLGAGTGARGMHRVETLTLAGRLFANVAFRLDPKRGADGNPWTQCVIGNEQLRAFRLTLDIPRRRAFFRPVVEQPGG